MRLLEGGGDPKEKFATEGCENGIGGKKKKKEQNKGGISASFASVSRDR